jgi:hypothetical protein
VDRRRNVALMVALMLCLALLGSWFLRIDKEDAARAKASAAVESTTPERPIAEIVDVPREAPKDGGALPYQAPIGPGVFRGRVIDAISREPIREFTVELLPQERTNSPPPQIRQSFRTKDGRFTYRGLPTGVWTLLTTAAGYQRFDISDARISENESTEEILIPMRAGLTVRGRIVDEITKDAIASALVSFREASMGRYEGNFRTRPSVRSGKDGSFVLEGVPPGAVRIEAGAPKYTTKEIETFVSAKPPPVEIALSKGGTVAGYLAGADGLTPVQGEVSLVSFDEYVAMATATGSAGEFSFAQVAAGRYLLTGRGGGLNGRREITLAHNERLEGIVLPMTAGHSIRGVISGLRPEEREEAVVVVTSDDNKNSGLAHQANADQRGAYEISGVAPGVVSIEVLVERRGQLHRVVQMPANGDLTVNFEYKTEARLTGRVTRGGKPLAGAVLNISAATADEGLFMHSTVTAQNGDYAINDAPQGEYTLSVGSYSSPDVRVSGDTVFDLDVPEAQVSGRVFEEGGKVPVVGAYVTIRPTRPNPRTEGWGDVSNHFGQFAIRGLQPGDFLLNAYKPGYELYRTPFSYGAPVADLAIYMRPARGVEIRLSDAASNKPITSIAVAEMFNGAPGIVMQLQADQNGVSYLPSGLAGSSLRFLARGYNPVDIVSWNGQLLDLRLQRQPTP